jgi:glycine/D-amino acid oxidase-like deaminating enzyme
LQPILRVFQNAKQAEAASQLKSLPGALPYLGAYEAAGAWGAALRDPYGSLITQGGGWLDTAAFCQFFQNLWEQQGRLAGEVFELKDLDTSVAQTKRPMYRGEAFDVVVFCQGWRAAQCALWDFVQWKPAAGDVLELQLSAGEGVPERLAGRILNGKQWLLPVGARRLRSGSTYRWDNLLQTPTPAERLQMLADLQATVSLQVEVVGSTCGVRPAIQDYQPVVGRHPQLPWLAILNGFGSRGVLYGPSHARMLAEHLLGNKPLPVTVDVHRFASGHRPCGAEAAGAKSP